VTVCGRRGLRADVQKPMDVTTLVQSAQMRNRNSGLSVFGNFLWCKRSDLDGWGHGSSAWRI
jgi:hypothetical protein